ncbi:hypothetical protein [Niabella beijingensis]|uniref:hypothetical protein n=1 Tax=Niabella beijingensis TaxID=2872700 RepID=UPI001CBF74F9|nr:hypothetical protein [Niabella beijingensis]MBZ4187400.1 hypothetical protein [Niabella beijingensis]
MRFLSHITAGIFSGILLCCCSCQAQQAPAARKDHLFTSYFQKTSGWIAGDGAYSIPLGNGQSLWTFGDSHINDFDSSTQTTPCLFQVRNAVFTMDQRYPMRTITYTGTATPPSYFSLGHDPHYWFWPGSGYAHGDSVYIFLGRLHKTGPGGMWGFENVDSGYVAVIRKDNFSHVDYRLLPPSNGIVFTSAVVKGLNDTCYVYGIKSNGMGNDLFVARFKAGAVVHSREYFDGTGWSRSSGEAHPIHSEFTASFNVCKIGKKYILITTALSVGCDQGKEIFVSVSDQPYGPFTNRHVVWEVDDTLEGHHPFFYIANAHPQFSDNNELLITYCINGYDSCVNTCENGRMNPDYYRPKAIRVPYALIDPGL